MQAFPVGSIIMKKYYLFLLVVIASMAACKEDPPKPVKKATPIRSLMNRNSPAIQRFTLMNEAGGTITGSKGTVIIIPPNTYGSSPGELSITLKEVNTRNEMAGSGIYTSAYGMHMTETQTMFELRASMNGGEVLPEKNAEVKMKRSTGAGPSTLKVFRLVKWLDSASNTNTQEWVENDKNWDYDVNTNFAKFSFRCTTWCNLGIYVTRNGVANNIRVVPPPGFGADNMQVFLDVNNVNGLVQHYQNVAGKTFNTYALEAGKAGQLIMVALKDEKYYAEVLQVTFTNAEQVLTVKKIDEISLEALEILLKSF
jgi:hypothetical protein